MKTKGTPVEKGSGVGHYATPKSTNYPAKMSDEQRIRQEFAGKKHPTAHCRSK